MKTAIMVVRTEVSPSSPVRLSRVEGRLLKCDGGMMLRWCFGFCLDNFGMPDGDRKTREQEFC